MFLELGCKQLYLVPFWRFVHGVVSMFPSDRVLSTDGFKHQPSKAKRRDSIVMDA